MVTPTPKFNLEKPGFGDLDWHIPHNQNFDRIDAALINVMGSQIGDPTYDLNLRSPALPNRVLRIKDGGDTPNDLEIHQVWIPFFRSAGFTQPNLNDLILGGFWIDKFQACMPLATATSRGGLTPNSPGAGVGAASKPHVVPWTDVSWNTARAALENRGGAANKSAGGTPTACAKIGRAHV